MTFDIVVAADEGDGIGKDGELPWRLPGDTAFLKRITTDTRDPERRNAVVMGRKTWETIPPKYRPLKRRLNAVITRQRDYAVPQGVVVAHDIDDALAQVAGSVERVFVLGGGEIYRQAVDMPGCRCIYLTRVEGRFPADAHFPPIPAAFTLSEASPRHEENGIGYRFEEWVRAR
jgi:dihydrofolate reductase / thymidylate synthase